MDPNALAPVVATQDFSLFALFIRADIIVKVVMGILAIALQPLAMQIFQFRP